MLYCFDKPANSSSAVFFPRKDIAMWMFEKEFPFFLVETRDYFKIKGINNWQFLKRIWGDRKYLTDVFVSTSEIKAGKEQLDHEVIKKSCLQIVIYKKINFWEEYTPLLWISWST